MGLWIKTLSVATQNESYGMLPSYSSVYYPVQESFFLLTVWMKLQLRPLKSYKASLCRYLHAIENDANYLVG